MYVSNIFFIIANSVLIRSSNILVRFFRMFAQGNIKNLQGKIDVSFCYTHRRLNSKDLLRGREQYEIQFVK